MEKTTYYNLMSSNIWELKRKGKVIISGKQFLLAWFIQSAENLIDLNHLEEYELYRNGKLYGKFELTFKIVDPEE